MENSNQRALVTIPLNQSTHFRSKEKARRQGLGSGIKTRLSAVQRGASGRAYYLLLSEDPGSAELEKTMMGGQAWLRFSPALGGAPQIQSTQKI